MFDVVTFDRKCPGRFVNIILMRNAASCQGMRADNGVRMCREDVLLSLIGKVYEVSISFCQRYVQQGIHWALAK